MDAVETCQKNGCTITIYRDPEPESPRDWDNLGKMICFHGRYRLGDEHDLKSSDFTGWDDLEKRLRKEGAIVVLPLFLYDHSGLRMKIGSFQGLLPGGHAELDSGQVGFIVAYRDDVLKEYEVKRVTRKLLEKVREALEGEVEAYDQYLSGQVYGYTVEDSSGDYVDSCWGCYGLEYTKQEAEGSLPEEKK